MTESITHGYIYIDENNNNNNNNDDDYDGDIIIIIISNFVMGCGK